MTENDVCKFQVASVRRLTGVLGTDRRKHALSVLYYRFLFNFMHLIPK